MEELLSTDRRYYFRLMGELVCAKVETNFSLLIINQPIGLQVLMTKYLEHEENNPIMMGEHKLGSSKSEKDLRDQL